MDKVNNLNIESQYPLPTPLDIHNELPLPPESEDFVAESRKTVVDILHGRDPRLLVIVGPCSVDSVPAALEYAERLKKLQPAVADKFFIIMRAYFEKPRTNLGWKGFVYDPGLDDTFRIETGLRLSRGLLLKLAAMKIPAATEFLDPIIPQYLCDLISWAAIGARTSESQTHRQLASGMSMPVGFKNATDGSITVAIDAIKTASASHSFLGVIHDGLTGVFKTRGNRNCHIVLRGSASEPNYGPEFIAFTRVLLEKSGLNPAIVIDCSHGNSGKVPQREPAVLQEIVRQINAGEKSIRGFMMESYLKTGKQDISKRTEATLGLSVTDACLGWEETEAVIRKAYDEIRSL